MVTTLKLE